jgi:transposase
MELCRNCKLNYATDHMISALSYLVLGTISLIFIRKEINYLDFSKVCGIIKLTYNAALKEVHMAKSQPDNPKEKSLRDSGALNTHPVSDALFSDSDFFDPRDLVQIKYEMLRKVHKESEPVSHAAASFGFSRPSFYKIRADFEREGITGLLPRKRGPRGGHKLTKQVLEFIKEICTVEQPMSTPALLDKVEKRFGIRVHRRSLERALRRYKKKRFRFRKTRTGRVSKKRRFFSRAL